MPNMHGFSDSFYETGFTDLRYALSNDRLEFLEKRVKELLPPGDAKSVLALMRYAKEVYK